MGGRDKSLYLKNLAARNRTISIQLAETHLISNTEGAEVHILEYAILRTAKEDNHRDITLLILLSHSNSACDI